MRANKFSLTTLAFFVVTAGACSAQVVDQTKPRTNFEIVVTNPTGKNGYEELVMATDILKTRADLRQAISPEAMDGGGALTLSDKRKFLFDPDVQKILGLIARAQSKPISNPREKMDDTTLLPEMVEFRNVARILNIKMYVELADGRVNLALDTFASGIKLGYVIQSDVLIGGLIGVAVDTLVIRRIAQHIPQFSVKDCDRMIATAKEWMRLPDPTISIFQSERTLGISVFEKYKNKPDALIDAFNITPKDPNYAISRQFASMGPQALAPIIADASALLNQGYDRVIAELKKPAWQRQDVPDYNNATPASTLAGMMMPTMGVAQDRFVQDQAHVQLLGVHAAIRKYRWEHDALPNNLAELKLGDLVIDPFSGQPLVYKKIDDTHYEVSSEGPPDRSAEAKGLGQRKRIVF
ncbi:MAG: hypothetical protein ABJA67_09865 [Chthonomonadales bacterium]